VIDTDCRGNDLTTVVVIDTDCRGNDLTTVVVIDTDCRSSELTTVVVIETDCRGNDITTVVVIGTDYIGPSHISTENTCHSSDDRMRDKCLLLSEQLRNEKKLYCAFIDFEKAFDRVWRDGLFHKLFLNNINGKMYNIIFNNFDFL
jgi:cellulose biosynthesis protein BcsQ